MHPFKLKIWFLKQLAADSGALTCFGHYLLRCSRHLILLAVLGEACGFSNTPCLFVDNFFKMYCMKILANFFHCEVWLLVFSREVNRRWLATTSNQIWITIELFIIFSHWFFVGINCLKRVVLVMLRKETLSVDLGHGKNLSRQSYIHSFLRVRNRSVNAV